jgi:hypothetical protein
MNINVFVMGLMTLALSYVAWTVWTAPSQANIQHFLPFVPIDVRKTKVYVSQTRDAGMFTERARRVAILRNADGTFSYKGSTNGYLEYALTAIAFLPSKPVCPPAPDVIWDGGNATSEVCDIVDGGNAQTEADAVDFGNALTNVCDV